MKRKGLMLRSGAYLWQSVYSTENLDFSKAELINDCQYSWRGTPRVAVLFTKISIEGGTVTERVTRPSRQIKL